MPELFADGIVSAETITFVGAFDRNGDPIEFTPRPGAIDIAQHNYLIDLQHTNDGRLFIGRPIVGRTFGRWAIPLARRVNDAAGAFAGAVVVGVDPNHFTSLFRKSELGPSDVMALVRSDGIVLARRLGDKTSQGDDISKSALMAEARLRTAGSYEASGSLDPTRKFFSFRQLDDYPVMVVVGTAEQTALAPYYERRNRSLRYAVVTTSVFVAFCALVLLAMMNRRRMIARTRDQLALIDQARDGIVVRDIDDRIRFWNKGAERLFGWSAAEAIGQRLDLLLHADPDRFRQATQTVLETGDWAGEVSQRHKDGHIVSIEDRWTMLRCPTMVPPTRRVTTG